MSESAAAAANGDDRTVDRGDVVREGDGDTRAPTVMPPAAVASPEPAAPATPTTMRGVDGRCGDDSPPATAGDDGLRSVIVAGDRNVIDGIPCACNADAAATVSLPPPLLALCDRACDGGGDGDGDSDGSALDSTIAGVAMRSAYHALNSLARQ